MGGGGDRRQIRPVSLTGLKPAQVASARPEFREVDPASIMVDGSYQRTLTDRSVKLIRKIVAEWDWSAFKPPVVVEVDGALHVVDGQHTATAAASHPGIDRIPVMVVRADEENARAAAFVRHNRDRVSVTPMQLHHSLLAAGDEDAVDVARACEVSGVTILRQPPAMGKFKPGETVAIGAIRTLVRRRFIIGAKRVLSVCVEARLAPISSDAIKAVESILFDSEYAGSVEPEALAATLRGLTAAQNADIAAFREAHRVPKWRAMAVVLFRNTRKKRRAS